MPYPRWMATITKRVFNPRQIKKSAYPLLPTSEGRPEDRICQGRNGSGRMPVDGQSP